jgi:hypothetical protein
MRKSVELDRPKVTIKQGACAYRNYDYTYSENVTIIAFTQQQWLRQSASLLRCQYIVCPDSAYLQHLLSNDHGKPVYCKYDKCNMCVII